METQEDASRTRVGRYHLVERIAVGGMAEVFLACERGTHALDRLLVIKRILPHLAENEDFVEMFMAEARIAARIGHPNVVQIFELGEAGGFPFIAMEYVSGSTLKELLKAARVAETRLPMGTVMDLMAQACAGAHAAHELVGPDGQLVGLVHRDLSPHNLMVTDNALVKLLDFGIAKAEQGMDNTRTGMLKGKISYMSPEQCKQHKLDRRSDVYALGIVFWELLAGRKMFYGMSELATMQTIVSGELKDVMEFRPDTPKAVIDVLLQSLEAAPADRFQTADDMRKALIEAARSSGIQVEQERTARLVRTLLGEVHDQRKQAVTSALEKTLVTLSSMVSPKTDDLAPPTATGSNTRTRAQTQTSVVQTMATTGLSAAAGGVIMLGMVGLALAGGYYYMQHNSLDPDALSPEVVPEGRVVTVLLAPTLTPEQLLEDLEPLRRYLQKKVDRPFRFRVAATYEEAGATVAKREVDFALLPYNTLITTLAQTPELMVLAHEVVDGSSASDGYLVVGRDTDAESVKDMIGSTVCYTDELSSTGYLLPRAYLRKKGLDPDVDFQAHFSGNHQQVLRDVLDGSCQLGGTYAGNYSTATQAGIAVAQLRILVPRTGSTPHDGWVTHPASEPKIRGRVTDALLAFDPIEHLGTDRLGEKKRVTGYVIPEDKWLRPLIEPEPPPN